MIFTFKKYFVQQADFQHWANDGLFAALDTLDDETRKSAQALFHQSIHNTVDHMLVVLRNTFSRLKGDNQLIGSEIVLYSDWRELKNALRAELRGLQRWLEAQPDSFFEESINYTPQRSMWVRDALTHIMNELAQHRGMISAVAMRLGAPAPELGYAYYKLEVQQHIQAIRKSS